MHEKRVLGAGFWVLSKAVFFRNTWKPTTSTPSLSNTRHPAPSFSAEVLADLFGAEGADAVEAEAEDDAVLGAQAGVEGEVLRGDGAAVPGVAEGDDRADERGAAATGPVLEVEEERGAAEQSALAVAEEEGGTPLRALLRAR